MPIKIFTIPFNEETQTFHDDLVPRPRTADPLIGTRHERRPPVLPIP